MNSITGRDHPVNSGASSSRALHVELTSQQRRLRHLRSIAARNIVNKNGSPLLDTYFTLHLCLEDRISRDFYKSEVIQDSLNPTWRSLDFGMLPDLLDTSVSCFVVKIWGGREEHFILLIEWKVNLDGLRYTGQQIRSRNPNEIIFGLNDGYYAADFDHKDHSERKKNSLLQVDQSSVRNSYSVFSLLRLHTAQRAIKQTQVTVQKIGKDIEEKLRTTTACTKRKKERECMQLRLGTLRSELERQRKALGRETDLQQKERAVLQKKEEAFSTKHRSLELERESLTEQQKECTAKRELFLKSNAQLTFRCRQLLSELSYIYPIDLVTTAANQSDYVICGVKLPNSEDFQAKDDGSVAVALGYTAHLVLMISCFLQIPLRYPVIHKGSRSSIKDTITDKLSEKEREFPLYPRGERFQFEYGVYLINKNIAQLRYQHGLSTPDLRQTLPNLKNFLEHGLLVRWCLRHRAGNVNSANHSDTRVGDDVALGTQAHRRCVVNQKAKRPSGTKGPKNITMNILTTTKKCDHITPVLASLHWLPVKVSADFMVLLLTYKALHGLAPTYLSDLVLPYIPTRTLWSQDAGLLCVPRISKQTAGVRAFSYRAPFLWNSLPNHVRDADSVSTFKSLLKTHLFSRSYD
uniref:UV radiation resistance associated gene n=1 Tax=Oncorhynchus kisutch TaxID=8019 RepID=A0A8C7MTC0_ONCKI